MEAVFLSKMLVPSYQSVWCHDPEDHNVYVGESVLDSASTPQILVYLIQSLRLWLKTNEYQVNCVKLWLRFFVIGVQIFVIALDSHSLALGGWCENSEKTLSGLELLLT
jgi:hypothetical protein